MFSTCLSSNTRNDGSSSLSSIRQLKILSRKVRSNDVLGSLSSNNLTTILLDHKEQQFLDYDYDDFEVNSEYMNITGEVNLVQKVNLRKCDYRVGK